RRALVVAIQLTNGREIRPFAFRLCTQGLAVLGAVPPCLQLSLVFHSLRKRITPITQRDSPVCDSARCVLPQYRVESFDSTAELEGMQERYCPVEFLLCPLAA